MGKKEGWESGVRSDRRYQNRLEKKKKKKGLRIRREEGNVEEKKGGERATKKDMRHK